jgi:D-sedoheptulose 7-phosphate isomerase
MTFAQRYLAETAILAAQIDADAVEHMATVLAAVRTRGGRLFFLGIGGGAGHASHAVNDFRKIAGFEAYAPTDNVAELTARTNDDGWDTVLLRWLEGSRLGPKDGLFVFSVGGGSLEPPISVPIVRAVQYGRGLGCTIVGIVGGDGGATSAVADACVLVPTVAPERRTPHTEAFQAVIWHLLVYHPLLQMAPAKWESIT